MRNAPSLAARGAVTLLVFVAAVWVTSVPQSAEAESAGTRVEVRIAAQRLVDGRTEFALEVWDGDRWGERLLPRGRFFPQSTTVDRWLISTVLTPASDSVVRISARLI